MNDLRFYKTRAKILWGDFGLPVIALVVSIGALVFVLSCLKDNKGIDLSDTQRTDTELTVDDSPGATTTSITTNITGNAPWLVVALCGVGWWVTHRKRNASFDRLITAIEDDDRDMKTQGLGVTVKARIRQQNDRYINARVAKLFPKKGMDDRKRGRDGG